MSLIGKPKCHSIMCPASVGIFFSIGGFSGFLSQSETFAFQDMKTFKTIVYVSEVLVKMSISHLNLFSSALCSHPQQR